MPASLFFDICKKDRKLIRSRGSESIAFGLIVKCLLKN